MKYFNALFLVVNICGSAFAQSNDFDTFEVRILSIEYIKHNPPLNSIQWLELPDLTIHYSYTYACKSEDEKPCRTMAHGSCSSSTIATPFIWKQPKSLTYNVDLTFPDKITGIKIQLYINGKLKKEQTLKDLKHPY